MYGVVYVAKCIIVCSVVLGVTHDVVYDVVRGKVNGMVCVSNFNWCHERHTGFLTGTLLVYIAC